MGCKNNTGKKLKKVYTITKQEKRRYNHGSNKLDNYQKRKENQPN